MEVLAKNGYEQFDFFSGRDLEVWKERQHEMVNALKRSMTIDGIPGAQTAAALRDLGYQDGLWALPPKAPPGNGTGSGHNPLEALLDAFFPTLVTAIGGDARKALEVVSSWLKQQQV